MVYTPEWNTINSRAIVENLFAYWATNQADALTWAGDGSLKAIKKFSDSVANRAVPVFPAAAFSDDSEAIDFAGDLITALYQPSFEFMVTNPNPDEAVRQSKVYVKAFTSMIVNCPEATLLSGTSATKSIIEDMTVAFDPIRADEEQIDFMQLFQIRPTFRLEASAFV
jgi:hypothetical protein